MVKKLIPLLLVLALATIAHAGDMTITTLDHQTYTDTAVEPDGISVMYDAGVVKISFKNLPADLQKKYGYNPDQAASYSAQEALAASQRNAAAMVAPAASPEGVNSQAEYERNQKIAAIEVRAKKMAWDAYNAESANLVQEDAGRSQVDIDLKDSLHPRNPNQEIADLTAKYKAQLMKEAGLTP